MGKLAEAIAKRDLGIWPEESIAKDFLGWLRYAELTHEEIESQISLANSVDSTHIIYVGMGGSSLGAMMLEEFNRALGTPNGRRVTFVDSTHPHLIASLDLTDTTVVLASKSGTTTEVDSVFAHLWDRMRKPANYIVLSDPDTPLARLARERAITRIVETPKDVGGRYSVLTPFGTTLGALVGFDLFGLFSGAQAVDWDAAEHRAEEIFARYVQGADKLGLQGNAQTGRIPMWLEQLIAESLGKSGKGIVPVPFDLDTDQSDRQLVEVAPTNPSALGSLIFGWELTTAMLGSLMEIDPFNQPDVQAAKNATKTILDQRRASTPLTGDRNDAIEFALKHATPEDYIAVMAFVDPTDERQILADLVGELAPLRPHAITYGIGPRFLHSTGQLHKGGANALVALQLVDETKEEVPIPGQEYGFRELFAAQSLGDFQALQAKARRVIRVNA
ncbi:MAG: hypothetical protein ACP5PJ_00630 [Acidimicrobiales bacterium]